MPPDTLKQTTKPGFVRQMAPHHVNQEQPPMNQLFVTDIIHFLDDNGAIASTLPPPAMIMATSLSNIIAQVTSQLNPQTTVNCWGQVNDLPCKGLIEAGVDIDTLEIIWACPICHDHGVIRQWQYTFFDCFEQWALDDEDTLPVLS